MIESNLVNLKQGIGLPGSSKKLQKGNAGKEQGQLMPFLCMMGQICRITTQGAEKILLNSRSGEGKMCVSFKKGNTNGRRGFFNIDSKNNILSPGNDKAKKTNQSLQVKGKGLVKSPHSAMHGLPVRVCAQTGETHRQTKDINPFMNALKGKGVKTNGSIPGKIDLLSKRDGQKQTEGKLKNIPEGSGLKKSKTGINNALMEDVRGPLKPGLNKQSIESGLRKSGLTGVVVGKNEAFKESRSLRTAVAVFRDGGFRQSGAARNPHVTVDAPVLLRPGLKNAAAAKGKSAEEPGRTWEKSFTLIKDDSGKNDIENLLKRPIFKSEETIEILHRKNSSPLHSIGKISSAGAYHHTFFHSGGSSVVINESVNNYGIEPRALINQIASGVKSSGRVRITLNPPSLGTLDMDVLVRDNKVHVILQAENNNVRQILQSNVESLKSSLRNHGLVADAINVLVQEKSDGADYGANYRSGQNETLFKEGRNREGNEEDQSGEQNSLNHNPSSFEEENAYVRSDGRVSLFA